MMSIDRSFGVTLSTASGSRAPVFQVIDDASGRHPLITIRAEGEDGRTALGGAEPWPIAGPGGRTLFPVFLYRTSDDNPTWAGPNSWGNVLINVNEQQFTFGRVLAGHGNDEMHILFRMLQDSN
ncbi:hypothetical protein [Rhodovulum sp. 12E13]|uniref:hypothetical protein n=1 Tax=Rhodovulum sp. 12E13 TaxID=2203891 RepID=UPI0011C04AED|nr:hypothetical protein [Rhodovulum sp. 12E13]